MREQVHSPAFHALQPRQSIVSANALQLLVLRPCPDRPFESLITDVHESCFLDQMLRVLSSAKWLSKSDAAFQSQRAPLIHIRSIKGTIIRSRNDTNFGLFKVCARLQRGVYLAVKRVVVGDASVYRSSMYEVKTRGCECPGCCEVIDVEIEVWWDVGGLDWTEIRGDNGR
jgi:hypothetical protein